MKSITKFAIFAFVFLAVWLLVGVSGLYAQDATSAAPEVVATVEVPADAPVVTVIDTAGPDTNTAEGEQSPVVLIRDQNPALLIALAVSNILVVLMLAVIVSLARKGFDALPSWAKELVLHNRPLVEHYLDSTFDVIDAETAKTTNTWDDEMSQRVRQTIREELEKSFKEVDQSTNAVG